MDATLLDDRHVDLQQHRRDFLAAEGSSLELIALPDKGFGVRTTASIEAGCCLLAEPPLAIIQLQSSREDTVACEHCLLPLRQKDAEDVQTSGECSFCRATYCCEQCVSDAWASGHDFLRASSRIELEHLEQLLVELGNVGEAFRLALKLLAKGAMSTCPDATDGRSSIFTLLDGFWGAPWWETAALAPELLQEARSTTATILELVQHFIPLPPNFGVNDMAKLVGQVRMNAVEVLVPSEDGAIVARGLAVYCVASAVNHDCKPNCTLQSCLPLPELRGWAVLQALNDLDEGEEVTIEYLEDAPDRHKQLLEQWRFQCICEKGRQRLSHHETIFRHAADGEKSRLPGSRAARGCPAFVRAGHWWSKRLRLQALVRVDASACGCVCIIYIYIRIYVCITLCTTISQHMSHLKGQSLGA
ncbi:Histone-lysine N-methyltransferase SMYD1 (SET and MYND domain-containing protein 1) [Durusdinium trenchii]|uniref:Histone-lysine N-methyltransferase SMYD1 (SET and MYND domain-containing protein 1) n=1 Tax=Durusdinium trenchii TaxID=1381693 RepID=A0ABP0HPM6_9DINO